MAASALQHLSAAEFDIGHHKAAITTVKEALEFAELCDDLVIRCNCLNLLGVFLLRFRDYGDAERYYEQALRLAVRIGEVNRIAAFALNLAVCQIRLGRPEGALPLLDRANETFSALNDRYYLTSTLIALAEAHLGLGRDREAQAILDSAAIPAEQFGDPLLLARTHVAYGRVFTANRDYSSALRAFRLALDLARRAQVPYMQGEAYHELGDLYMLRGQVEDARRCWQTALSIYADVPSPEVDALVEKLRRIAGAGAAS